MEGKDLIKHLGLSKDLGDLVNLYKQVPKDGKIVVDLAMVLEVKFWLMKTKLTDMVTVAKRYELNKKQERDNTLIDVGSEEDAPNSIAGKEHYAKSDTRWRELQKESKQAEVLREYLENKRQDFEQAVYVMRSIQTFERNDKKSMPTQEV